MRKAGNGKGKLRGKKTRTEHENKGGMEKNRRISERRKQK